MKEILLKLSTYKTALELYHKESKKEEITKINNSIEIIQNKTYNSYYRQRSDIQSLLDGTKNIVDKVNDIKDSKIFQYFFFEITNKKDNSPFDKAYDEFIKFKEELAEKGENFVNQKSNQNEIQTSQ